MELKNWILLILLGAVWGSAFMFIKISADDFGPILLVNLRLLLAGALFLPFLLQKKYLAYFKWPEGFKCIKCGHTGGQIRDNSSRTCNKCSHTESATANTLS